MNYRLRFRNSHNASVWVAIMYYDPVGCAEGGTSTPDWAWATKGWWKIAPGGEAYVLGTDNRYACFYGEGEDGARWAGGYSGRVFAFPFDYCNNIGVSGPTHWYVGMRFIDLGERSDWDKLWGVTHDHYVNLV